MMLRLLFSLLLLGALFATPCAAQNSLTRLRLVHQSTPLPAGTAFVVLQKMSTERVGTNWQPEFIDAADFPVTSIEPIQFDTLATDQESQAQYIRTSATGHLYFFYALTPDDDLYWSYSYQRNQPKFDALELGAMSVAPLTDSSIGDVIRSRFFSGEAAGTLPESTASDTLASPLDSDPIEASAADRAAEIPPAPPPTSDLLRSATSTGATAWWHWFAWGLLLLTSAGLFYQHQRIRTLTAELHLLQSKVPLPTPVSPHPPKPRAAPASVVSEPVEPPPPAEDEQEAPSLPSEPNPAASSNPKPVPRPLADAPDLAGAKEAVAHADATLASTSRTLHEQEAFAKAMRTEALSDFEAMRRNLEALNQLADDLKRPDTDDDQG